MRRADSAAVLWPLTSTMPRVGRSSSAISFRMVLLPAPERPVRNTISPVPTSKVAALSASRPFGYRLLARSKRIIRLLYTGPGAQQGIDESLGREFAEILRLLADADEADRQLQLACDGDHDAATRGAVELGQHQARDAHCGMELAGLRQCVLALVGIEHQQHLVGSPLIHARQHAADLLQLFHQVRLAVQAPGSVGDEDV